MEEITKLPEGLSDRPCAGDVVRLTADWLWLQPGALGMIGGETGKPRAEASITFNFSAHIDEWYVSCSGGPGTIYTDMHKLRPTGEVAIVKAWRWKDGMSGAGRGVDYMREARVWEWDGK